MQKIISAHSHIKKYVFRILWILPFLFAITSIRSTNESGLDNIYQSKIDGPHESAQALVLLRRMSYQIRGIPPGLDEIQDFEKANPDTRISEFSVRYLKSPEYAQYWSGIFGSMLRENYNTRGSQKGSFLKYIQDSLHTNKPYNRFVSEMILATGSSKSNPATGFYLRDEADPLQMAEYVGRAFYGAKLSCARCHNHPFDHSYTRRDFYGFAAFFSQVYQMNRLKTDGIPNHRMEDLPTKHQKLVQEEKREWNRNDWNKMSKAQQKKYMEKNRLEFYEIAYNKNLELRFPHTDDSPGGDLVKLKFPDGSKSYIEDGDDRRKEFVNWLTNKKNDRFRKVLINRIWSHYMGWSFFYPFDDWNDETKINQPEILNHLDEVFLRHDYRIKDLVFYIVNTQAWQRRSAAPNDDDKDNPYKYFLAKRLDPSQVLNSMITGVHKQPMKHIQERAHLQSNDLDGKGKVLGVLENRRELLDACQVARPAHSSTLLGVFGEGEREDIDDNNEDPTIDQVLALLNGRVTNQILNEMRNTNHWLQKDYQSHNDMLKTMDQIYLSLLGRHLHESETKFYQEYFNPKFSSQKKEFDLKIAQTAVWSILNSYEFLHLY